MPPTSFHKVLADWVFRGWLRPLDQAFVDFLDQILRPSGPEPASSTLVLLSAALVSYQAGRGHICLDLNLVLEDPTAILPPEAPPPNVRLPAHIIRPADLLSDLLPEPTCSAWEQALQTSPLIDTGAGNSPLVLSAGRLYLRRYWRYEQQVARHILSRLGYAPPPPSTPSAPCTLPSRLDTYFNDLRTPEEQSKSTIHWQSVAATMAAGSTFCVISGGPGTGKTTTVVRLLGLLQELALARGARPLRIRLATPTGKAAARLTESIGLALNRIPEIVRPHIPAEASTLHRLLGRRPDTRLWTHNVRNPLHLDVLVVDEASMIDLEMMAALLEALPSSARLILLGDKDQLASVEAGAVLGDLCREADRPAWQPATVAWLAEHSGYDLSPWIGNGSALAQHICLLRHSHRFGPNSGIGALARAVNRPKDLTGDQAPFSNITMVWSQGYSDIEQLIMPGMRDQRFADLILHGTPGEHTTDSNGGKSLPPGGYRDYLEYVQAGPGQMPEDEWLTTVLQKFNQFRVLAALREGEWGVGGLNDRIAAILYSAGLIPAREGWYSGRPVLITRNDYSLGLMNGDVGLTLRLREELSKENGRLTVVFAMPDGRLKKVRPSRLSEVETVYAMTVHKAQGSEFDHTVLVLPDLAGPLITRELVYTGITRARRHFTLLAPKAAILEHAAQQRTRRASGLGEIIS